MSRGRRMKMINEKRKHKATQENTTMATKREDFLWNNERTLAAFHRVIKQKPAGLHKYFIILKIKHQLSERLKMDVPMEAIYSYLHTRWNMNEVDEIAKYQVRKLKKKDFELPQTEEWIRLIKEQKDLIDSNYTNTDCEANKSSCDQ